MEKNTENLMKHFASVLRGRAMGKPEAFKITPVIARELSRKELIQILKKQFEGTIPKEHNLAELENIELLDLIGDEMYIISYVTQKWSTKSIAVSKPKAQKGEEPIKKKTSQTQNEKKK